MVLSTEEVAAAMPEEMIFEKTVSKVEDTESSEQELGIQQLPESDSASEQESAGEEAEAEPALAAEPKEDDLWEVVGGVDKGGIIVRTGRDPTSPQAEQRLSTGAVIVCLEREGLRLHYRKLTGEGPESGWVCTQVQGKDLVVKAATNEGEPGEEVLRQYVERFGKAEEGRGQFNRQCFSWRFDQSATHMQQVSRHETYADLEADLGLRAGTLAKGPIQDVRARRQRTKQAGGNPKPGGRQLHLTFGYAGSLDIKPSFARFDIRDKVCNYVGGFLHGQVVRDDTGAEFAVIGVKKAEGVMRLWFQPLGLNRRAAGAFPHASAATLRARLTLLEGRTHVFEPACSEDFASAEDSDGEEMMLCPHCRLPVGESGYYDKDQREVLLHGECMAQVMLHELKSEEAKRLEEDAVLKKERRREFDIGWAVERVPRNLVPATKLQCQFLPKGMCCLVFNPAHRTISVAATVEPSAAINLEYLSIALQVRLREGREPLFSLDPVLPENTKGSRAEALVNFKDEMQVKRFEPEWLNGTSAGEVMFQADYHLKELSMGEYEQPVVGMKSCHDLAEAEGDDKQWRAREWFVVRKAEVQLSEDNVLIPCVKMGVEAWEQVMGPDGLEDAKLTRPDHPLVQYAEAFTNNFDLIAERKSVIYHLRELAKASVMAKFLLEADIDLEDTWFELAGEPKPDCKLEIPQLWNERTRARICVHNGSIVDAEGVTPKMHGVYGGVQFGLDRFRVSAVKPMGRSLQPTLLSSVAAPVTGRVGAPYYRPTARPGFPGITVRPSALVTAPSALAPSRLTPSGLAPSVLQPSRLAPSMLAPSMLAPRGEPMGVDLNLDRFDLSNVTRTTAEKKLGSWAATEACASMGNAFWTALKDESKSIFKEEDRKLLLAVFNPCLSDREKEGELFCPPDTSFAYVTKLRSLIKEEEMVRQRRKDHFLSERFVASDPGFLFPYSWTTAFEVAHGLPQSKATTPQGSWLTLRPDYKAEAAVFADILKTAAPVFDKTTEDGMRFRIYRFGSLQVRTTQEYNCEEEVGAVFSIRTARGPVMYSGLGGEQFVKVTEYVEWAGSTLLAAQDSQPAEKATGAARRRSYIVLETDQGNFVVTEKLADGTLKWVEDPKDVEDRNSLAKVIRTADCCVPVYEMRRFHAQEAQREARGTSEGKRYAQAVFSAAQGDFHGVHSGFGKPSGSGRWRLQGLPMRRGAAPAPVVPMPSSELF